MVKAEGGGGGGGRWEGKLGAKDWRRAEWRVARRGNSKSMGEPSRLERGDEESKIYLGIRG